MVGNLLCNACTIFSDKVGLKSQDTNPPSKFNFQKKGEKMRKQGVKSYKHFLTCKFLKVGIIVTAIHRYFQVFYVIGN